ncbi:MAG: DNA repair protein RecO C-terminal domain-containing protein, partial [Rikenellaceae bacterium]
IAEFLYRVVREREAQPMLFDYIIGCIKSLDSMSDKAAANFHLYFTINIARFLGFYPENEYFDDSFFDIALCKFVVIKPLHLNYISADGSRLMGDLLKINLEHLSELQLNREKRRYLLQNIISFFGYHHDTVYKIESVKILSEVF